MNVNKRARNDLTLDQKRELIAYSREYPNFKQVHLKIHFQNKWNTKIGTSTISDILKNSEKYFDNENIKAFGSKRLRKAEQPYLERMMILFISDAHAHNIPISDDILIEQAKRYGGQIGISTFEFKYSSGWLEKFKKRHNLSAKTMSGEKASSDLANLKTHRNDEFILQSYFEECLHFNSNDLDLLDNIKARLIEQHELNKKQVNLHMFLK